MRRLKQSFAAAVSFLTSLVFGFWLFNRLLGFVRAIRPHTGTPDSLQDSQDKEPDNSETIAREVDDPTRRRFLTLLSAGAGGLVATATAAPAALFVLVPMFRTVPPVWRNIGPLDDYEVGATVRVNFQDPAPLPWAGVTSDSAAWLRRIDTNRFEAHSIYCTHLGCAVRWLDDARLYMCPCHGAVFYADGRVAAGPARRPLVQHAVRVRDGEVEIETVPLPVTGPITETSE